MKNQCSVNNKLSKSTFLSLLGPKKYIKEQSNIFGNSEKFLYKGKMEEISYEENGLCNSTFCYDDKY